MGILRRLREWREDKNGTLIGPNIEADSLKTEERTIEKIGTYAFDGTDRSINGNDNYEQTRLNNTRFDDRNDLNGSNDAIDISFDGRYVIRGVVQWQQLPDGTKAETEVRLNNSRVAVSQSSTGTTTFPTIPAQSEQRLVVGDTVSLHAKQDSGAPVDYNGKESATYLSIRQVA